MFVDTLIQAPVSSPAPARPVLERIPAPAQTRPSTSWYLACKATAEFAAAVGLLVLAGPVILLCAVLVKLTSRGPIFYSQVRLGRDGRPFLIHKLRTMRQ